MTAAEALAWVASRDSKFAAELYAEDTAGVAVALAYRKVVDRVVGDLTLDEARSRLSESCLNGRVRAFGKAPDQISATHIPIPRSDWRWLVIGSEGSNVEAFSAGKAPQSIRWQDPLFSRMDVRTAFETEAIPTPPATTSAPLVRIPTKAETTAAYRDWVAKHEGATPPSRVEDEKYMKGLFPHIPRDRVRDLRSEFAPEPWRRRGRRKSAK
jgi:hypothetical protein